MPIIWLVMSNAESKPSRRASGKLTSTTISRSTPMLRASSTGRLSTRPPSTSSRPFSSTGVSTPGRRHARAQHGHQVALLQHDGLAGLEIGRERAEWRRQLVEVLHVGHAHRGRAQHLRDLVPLHQAERQHDALRRVHAERAWREDVAIVLLAPIGEVAARRAVTDHFLPVELAEHALDFLAASTPPRTTRRRRRPCWCRRSHRSGCASPRARG